MKTYIVGGWVRDTELKRSGYPVDPKDKDWVVVGATPEEMIKAGYLPVGKDFPVFLHPETHEEYALARQERKNGVGYHGFVFYTDPSITLEEDLVRRDLTINAMAVDDDGKITDPFGGMKDLKDGILRHVGSAFTEDPVRLLRLARFAARFPKFTVAPETFELLKHMVESGETDHLVAERVFQEMEGALSEKAPSRFFEVLSECGYLQRSFPAWNVSKALIASLDRLVAEPASLMRFALSLSATDEKDQETLMKSVRAPSVYIDLARMTARYAGAFSAAQKNADAMVDLLGKTDALRKPERFIELLSLASFTDKRVDDAVWIFAFEAFRSVDAGKIASEQSDPKQIPAAIAAARRNAIAAMMP